jgi:thiol-disulfide isomerase/thioredoxin
MSSSVSFVGRVALVLAPLTLATGCTRSSDTASSRSDEAAGTEAASVESAPASRTGTASAPAAHALQWYRAAFRGKDTPEVPVYLGLPPVGTKGPGKVVTGTHESDIEVAWGGKQLRVSYPLLHALVEARLDAKGRLSGGTWLVDTKPLGKFHLPFEAQPVDGPAPEQLFDENTLPGEPIDLGAPTTTWRASFHESGTGKLVLRQEAPGLFNATILFPTGNAVYVAGNGRGDRILMSSLLNLSFYYVALEFDAARKTMTGDWIAGPKLDWREKLKARRTGDFELEMQIKKKQDDQLLSMPQLERYRGAPLIVEMGGSWCDACKHAAGALKKIYQRHRADGLQIVSLSYEFTDDSAYNAKRAEEFKAVHKIPWEVIAVDGSIERAWEIIPQGIEGVEDTTGFPITLFVNPDGTIHAVQSSFAGPEHPEVYRLWVAAYEKGAAAIVDGARGTAK